MSPAAIPGGSRQAPRPTEPIWRLMSCTTRRPVVNWLDSNSDELK